MNLPKLGASWWVVVGITLCGLALCTLHDIRLGGYVMAGALVVAAGARAMLPDSSVAALAVRSRGIDVVLLLALAVAVATLFAQVKLTD